jgi:hypothetical protein
LQALIDKRAAGRTLTAGAPVDLVAERLTLVSEHLAAQDCPSALAELQQLSKRLADYPANQPDWHYVDDLQVLVAKLCRRMTLSQADLVSRQALSR